MITDCTPANVVSISQELSPATQKPCLAREVASTVVQLENGKCEAYKGGMGLLQRAKGKVWAKIHYKLSSANPGNTVPLYSICGFECYTENVFTTKLLKELIDKTP